MGVAGRVIGDQSESLSLAGLGEAERGSPAGRGPEGQCTAR